MVKAKKRKILVVHLYPSGIEGKGKKRTKIVTSVLTPKQYIRRFYSSSYHERTNYAIQVKLYRKKATEKNLSIKRYKQRQKKERESFKKEYKRYKKSKRKKSKNA